MPGEKKLDFNPEAVVITQEECIRFEKEHNIKLANSNDAQDAFHYENDFRTVKAYDYIWHFGENQARVIKAYYEAAQNKEHPSLYAKKVLQEGQVLSHLPTTNLCPRRYS